MLSHIYSKAVCKIILALSYSNTIEGTTHQELLAAQHFLHVDVIEKEEHGSFHFVCVLVVLQVAQHMLQQGEDPFRRGGGWAAQSNFAEYFAPRRKRLVTRHASS